MQNCMGLSSTATKLFAWCLRLNVQRAQPLPSWNWVVNIRKICWPIQISGDSILSSQMTKTFRDNCDINIVQQTSCKPNIQMQLKTYFFVPFLRPCMHLNYGVISGSHACRDCGWHIILVAEPYTTCPGERALVAIRFNVTFLPLRHCYVNTSTCFLKDAESLATYGYVLWCSQIVFTRHYSLNTINTFYSVNEWSNFAVSVWSRAWQATMLSHFT